MTRKPPTFSPYSYYGSAQSRLPDTQPSTLPATHRHLFRQVIGWRPIRLLIYLVVVAMVFHGGWSMHVAAEEAAYRHQQLAALQAATTKSKVFSQQLTSLLAQSPGISVSVAVVSPYLGVQEFGSKQVFDAASTGKLLTAVTFLHQVELGQASLSQTIQGHSAQALLDAMIIKSDDGAWAILNDYLSHAALQKYAQALGLTSYTADGNTISTRDMANLLSLINEGDTLQSVHRQLLLSEMARANYRDYIVPAVNPGYQVFHKIGLDQDTVDDAAIIKNGNQSLVLVIYTDGHGSYQWAARAELMQAITHDAETAYL